MVDGVASLSSGLRTPGGALAAELRYVGGRSALVNALRSFPQTTEQLLHVDKYLERERALPVRLPAGAGGARLTSSQTFGELDVRALLTAFDVGRVDRAASGWGGGRTGVYRDSSGPQAVVLALDWDEGTDADEWAETVPRYLGAAFGAARDVVFARSGVRTAIVFAPSLGDGAAIAQAAVSG
jgi:hypothetical protein